MSVKYNTAVELAELALTSMLTDKPNVKPSGNELLEWIYKNCPDKAPLVEKSWPSFLTKAAADPKSRVMRDPGKYGFTLSPVEEVVPSSLPTEDGHGLSKELPDKVNEEVAASSRVARERILYGLLVQWLKSRDYRAEDTSYLKKGGQWGNPDVAGIRALELIGGTSHFELLTIEAKINLENWRRFFFEAVSHKRFADRAYFAFAVASEEPSVTKLAEFQELRDYGEKYRVGVLAIFFQNKDHQVLLNGDKDSVAALSLSNVRIEEVWPAIHDPVSMFAQDEFIRNNLDLNTLQEFYGFGSDLD